MRDLRSREQGDSGVRGRLMAAMRTVANVALGLVAAAGLYVWLVLWFRTDAFGRSRTPETWGELAVDGWLWASIVMSLVAAFATTEKRRTGRWSKPQIALRIVLYALVVWALFIGVQAVAWLSVIWSGNT